MGARAWTQACCALEGVEVGFALALGAAVATAVLAVVGEATGVGEAGTLVGVAVTGAVGEADAGTLVGVAAGVGERGTGVTVAGAASARAGNWRPTNPEMLRRRKKWRR